MAKEPISVELPTKAPAKVPEKSAENEFDRFHPAMPQIPGVTKTKASPRRGLDPAAKQRLFQIMGLAGMFLVVVAALLWWIKSIPTRVIAPSPVEPVIAETPVPTPPPPNPVETSFDGSSIAASVEELAKPWSAKKFTFIKPLTREPVDAMVIRLPGGVLWAFALMEPYGKCDLEFVKDLGLIASKYGYRAGHPMVVNPCSSTVYDPLKVGPLGASTWVRGEIVQGGGLRPPISIDVQVRGRSIVADRIE